MKVQPLIVSMPVAAKELLAVTGVVGVWKSPFTTVIAAWDVPAKRAARAVVDMNCFESFIFVFLWLSRVGHQLGRDHIKV